MVEKLPSEQLEDGLHDELNSLKKETESKNYEANSDHEKQKDTVESKLIQEQQAELETLHRDHELETLHTSADNLKKQIEQQHTTQQFMHPESMTEEQITIASNIGRQESSKKIENIIQSTKRIPEWFHNS